MNVGIDARLLNHTSGIGRYTRSLVSEYIRDATHHHDQLALFCDTPSENEQPPFPDNVNTIIAACPRRILWTNWSLPPLLRREQIDVYHGVCNFELPLRKVCRYVVTIHDLIPLFFPKLVPKKHLLFFRLFMKRAAHVADIIITDSEHSKQDIIRHLKVPEEKLRVIYLGYDQRYRRIHDHAAIANVLASYGIRRPYLLFVGVVEPKKNLERLVEAYAVLRRQSAAYRDLKLVIAGGQGWFGEPLRRAVKASGYARDILFTGFVPDEHLPALYSGAEVFVFPSLYEGFGLPVLEAMSCGVPVVTANVSSLPEIAGDAGLLIDPYNIQELADTLVMLLADSSLQERMRVKGYRQARKFSWQRTAQATYQVYREAYQR